MGLRTRTIARGPNKGHVDLEPPPTLDPATTPGRTRMAMYHRNQWSFYADGYFSSDSHVFARKGPRSPYKERIGSVYQIWPEVFMKEA